MIIVPPVAPQAVPVGALTGRGRMHTIQWGRVLRSPAGAQSRIPAQEKPQMRGVEASEIPPRQRIAEERTGEQTVTADGVYRRIAAGRTASATANLLFHTAPSAFDGKLSAVLDKVSNVYANGGPVLQDRILSFLVKLSIDLRSFLPHWVLTEGMDANAIADAAQEASKTLARLIETGGEAPTAVMARLRTETVARLKAEGVTDETTARVTVNRTMGESLADYVQNIAAEMQSSNLIEVAWARIRGDTQTQLGNDYAAFLQYMIWLGGSFVTTNPVLIKMAWDTDPEFWNKRVDDLILSRYTPAELKTLSEAPESELDAAVTAINSMVTMAVVGENCRLLRDIFLVTEGREGYVSLQVDPRNHDESERMVAEARGLYADLERRLRGVPNVVFKLPATAAGTLAAQKLTSEGIGVTITVSFSVFQALGFGEVLSRGKAPVCYIALMNGRLAYPVRDEMKEKRVPRGVEAARWAGVEVARKAYRRLYTPKGNGGMGIDPERVKLVIASLRIYDDWIPDMTELLGSPVITVFPNVRRKFDSHAREFVGKSVLNPTPLEDMRILRESEIFRQAWWMPGDEEQFKPEQVLTLAPKDADALAKWPPVAETLGQFIELYEEMAEMVKGRIRRVASLQRDC